jgi:uncharacterized protein (TIGR02421 family)
MMTESPRPASITKHFIESAVARLHENERIRRRLPIWGRVHIERQLPFLCVYRRPAGRSDEGTDMLVRGEASHLVASGEQRLRRGLSAFVRAVATTQKETFGGFLIVEIWASPEDNDNTQNGALRRPHFQIMAPRAAELSSTIDILESALRRVRLRQFTPEVQTIRAGFASPPGLSRLIGAREAAELGITYIGIEIRPIYRSANGHVYPAVLRSLHREMARAFRRVFFEFTRSNTSHRPPHFLALGPRLMVKAVWEVDRQLAEVSNGFDFLLGVTPVNSRRAWLAFERMRFEKEPAFIYRPLPIAPSLLKRMLFSIPIERVEDPVVGQLFAEKQDELDRQLTALTDRNTPRFRYGSLQLFGGVDDTHMRLAEEVLKTIPPRSRENSGRATVDAFQFARRAEEEVEFFRKSYPEISARIELRDDISGLMVSRGNLLVPRETKIPVSRVEALIQHEVGTHVLTYYNGRAQPFRQLYSGLAGYEELQEGLAVLSEYFVGGFSRPRLRLLAARVIAVRRLMEGASFVETFRELDRQFEFARYAAYTVTMRVYRAGGLTKDASYFKGLLRLLDYLRQGGELDKLFIGKISASHVPIVKELLWRQVLRPPPLKPRYMEYPETIKKLARLRNGLSLFDLIQRAQDEGKPVQGRKRPPGAHA